MWKNLASFKKDQFESKLDDIFKKPLEYTTNEFQEKIKYLTKGTIEATIKSIRNRMPFLKEEVHTKISLIFKA
jgi:hypothetical protein